MKPDKAELTAAIETCWEAVLDAKFSHMTNPMEEPTIRLQTFYLILQATLAPRRIQHEQIGSVKHENVDPDANADWRKSL